MKYWFMLVAGPVIFGACAVKRQTETSRRASADIAVQAAYAAFRSDSITGIRDRSLVLERRWEQILPETGATHRYTEQVRLNGRDSLALSHASGESARTETHRAVRLEERRSDRSERQPAPWGWLWWALGAVALGWLVRQAFRLWPFK